MEPLSIFLLLVMLLCVGLLAGLLRDIRRFRTFLTLHSRGLPIPCKGRFFTRRFEQLWNQTSAAFTLKKTAQPERPDLGNLLSLGNSLSVHLDRLASAAGEACEMLLAQTAPDVVAAAVILLDEEKRPSVAGARGLPQGRAHESLLAAFESESDRGSFGNGFAATSQQLVPRQGDIFDFSTFGIGSSYFSAIRNGESITGAIWLGMRRIEAGLPRERRLFIEALTQHFASSFSIAKRFEGTIAEHDRERKWLIGMSHDMRTPGNTALCAIQTLLDESFGPLSETQKTQIDIVRQCLDDQLDLLADVMDLAKHRRGLLQPQARGFKLGDELERMILGFSKEAMEKGLILDCDPWPKNVYFADPKQIRRVFSNLIGNAIKYTNSGKVQIRFRVLTHRLSVSISDTGCGIPEDERHLLFREFSRLSPGQAQPGVGLGLSISKTLCEINGTSLSYTPSPTGGSVFSFTLPVFTEAHVRLPKFKNVLILDDCKATGKAHARMLSGLSEKIVMTTTCSEAIREAQKTPPDLVISDLYLEGETSERFLKFMKEAGSSAQMILATGTGDPNPLVELGQKYSLKIVEKPFDRTALHAAITSPQR